MTFLSVPNDELLDALGKNTSPFRMHALGKEAFKNSISILAARASTCNPPSAASLLQRFHQNAEQIHQICERLAKWHHEGKALPSSTEWLLDNRYVIQSVIDEVRQDLPRNYSKQLKSYSTGEFKGYPRIYPLSIALLSFADSNLNESLIQEMVSVYQQVSPLEIGELWAVPTMLRLGLIENLRRLADHIINSIEEQDQGNDLIRSLIQGKQVPFPANPSLTFLISAWEAMRGTDLPPTVANSVFTDWMNEKLKDVQVVQQHVYSQQAADQVSIGNSITSLRLLNVIDWTRFFEQLSVVEKELRRDPIYPEQDFTTRDACRRTVEKLARAARYSEVKVVRMALELSRSSSQAVARNNVTYWLLDDGREQLRQKLKLRRFHAGTVSEWILQHPYASYFGTVGIITILLFLFTNSWQEIQLFTAVVLAVSFFLALDLAVMLVNALANRFVNPRILPRYEWKKGIPDKYATVVTIPTLIGQEKDVPRMLLRLEQHYLANPDPHLWFAILSDFPDAPTAEQPRESELLHVLMQGVRELNGRYGCIDEPRFFVFHRHRQWNASEKCWMGWERKRGKLIEFNRLLRGDTETNFSAISAGIAHLPRIKYVLTLDADTVLPRDAARQMIARLAHPLNRAVLTPDGTQVEHGYGILQPRVNFLVITGMRSWFARWMAGSLGIDPYATASSDTYMDLFGRGTFTGKGLYDIDVFQALLDEHFPENRILSHDLIESNFVPCALATDVDVYDEFPSTYLAYAKREHRWIRGDWQLLPWLRKRITTQKGHISNSQDALARWKIIDNLRRSLRAPVTLIAIVLSWFLGQPQSAILLCLALVPVFLPVILQICSISLQVFMNGNWRGWFYRIREQAGYTLMQGVLQLIFLPHQAVFNIDAIFRTLYRLWISHRNLLHWESAAVVEQKLQHSSSSYFNSMISTTILSVTITLAMFFASPVAIFMAVGWLLAWNLAPLVAYLVSGPISRRDVALSAEETEYLERIVQKTWHFFETFVGPEDHWLPPDNFQEEPCGSVAHRTSPTNIGVYLLCTLTAYHFKLIPLSQALERISNAFTTLEKLPKHNGHLLNWYETNTLKPLLPEYVSTVDSGNFWASLLALKNGLRDVIHTPEGKKHEPTIDLLTHRIEQLIEPMDFRFLYNGDRNLFSIGYNLSTHHLDNNHYDLLASEACIASFLAVAFGQTPRKHWFQLARLYCSIGSNMGLISWGGTMFEYLMPRLLLPILPDVLMDRMQHAAVKRQIDYGCEVNKPWGISESAYYAFDNAKQYQYQSFGVPGLGLKRGLSRDCVVAPYATLLAVDVKPREAIANLKRLTREGGEGEYGYYEAIDYTKSRLPQDKSSAVIRTYMAHHQGMGMLAIANRLKDSLIPRWLHQEAAVKSSELLLQERMPYEAPLMRSEVMEDEAEEPVHDVVMSSRRIVTADTPVPRIHLLSNGRYSIMVNNSGSGYSRWNDLDILRWRSDPTTDLFGTFLYIRDQREKHLWSAAHLPTGKLANQYEVIYSLDKADFHRVDGDVETLTEVTVANDADVELRKVTLTNRGRRSHYLDITSYAEVVLNQSAADHSHPAFGKLFLETEWLPQYSAILCRRRPRSPEQKPVWAFHVITHLDAEGSVSFETDRARFLGRRRTPVDPQAIEPSCRLLSGTAGAVLDPIFSIRRSVKIKVEQQVTLAFTTGYASSREEAIALADRFHSLSAVNRVFELVYAHTRIELHHAQLKPDDVHLFQRLAGHLLYPIAAMRASADTLASNQLGQSALWSFGISGDLPIALIRLHGKSGLQLKQMIQAHDYWRLKGLKSDLVILCENAGGYYDEAYEFALNLVRSVGKGELLDKNGGIFVRKGSQMPNAERTLLLSYANLVIDDKLGSLHLQGAHLPTPRIPNSELSFELENTYQQVRRGSDSSEFQNSYGSLNKDGSEYTIAPNAHEKIPPLPWSNIIANPSAGCIVTDSGSGYTWVGNSQLNRLTPWSNDPVTDQPGEVIYLQDMSTGQTWCPTPLPIRNAGQFIVKHGQGFSQFKSSVNDIQHELTITMAASDPVKITSLKLNNQSDDPKQICMSFLVEWVLGTLRHKSIPFLITKWDHHSKKAMLVRNPCHPDHPQAVAFVATTMSVDSYTGNRTEFVGRNRSLAAPLGLCFTDLTRQVGAGLDPCSVLRGFVTLIPQQEVSIKFFLGQADNEELALELISRYVEPRQEKTAAPSFVQQWETWKDQLQVKTPDVAFDALLNHWLLYQTLSCRVWGRSAFYQSGGAFGFRDQLQDVMAVVYSRPDISREHILHAASRQFVEGDVQHWWHEPSGHGVRTRFSDDFLWLPFVVAHYTDVTGDTLILDEHVSFLKAEPLPDGVHERYGPAATAEEPASLYEHCVRALDHGWKLGTHGLPLMGCGDWNDGMNLVGIQGKGESIWVAWFQINCLKRFAAIAAQRNDQARQLEFTLRATLLKEAVERHGYDGHWYKRAFFDDGTPLGSSANDSCQIDSIVQSWVVLSGMSEPGRATSGINAALERLVDSENRLVHLFDPPFDKTTLEPGYIKGYLPGIRENGGQYTHGVCWLIQALTQMNRPDDAWRIFDLINPLKITAHETGVKRYQGEPYVIAADVYSHPQHTGRVGWTWYTGSASWLYRVALENILGFRLRGNHLQIQPSIPRHWPGFSVTYTYGRTIYSIEFMSVQEGKGQVNLDGKQLSDSVIPLLDDGKLHRVTINQSMKKIA